MRGGRDAPYRTYRNGSSAGAAPHDLDTLIDELRAYHAIYRPLFQRREPREWSERYRHGLLLELPRKSIEPRVLALEGPYRKAVRARQQLLRERAWDDAAMLARHWPAVERELGDDDGVLLLDGRDVPTQGPQAVGVKRQYGGELGKRANGQAGVFLGYASRHGETLLDRRWYRPQAWLADEAYAERRAACGVPAEVGFTTKRVLGWAMIPAVHQAGRLRCRWVPVTKPSAVTPRGSTRALGWAGYDPKCPTTRGAGWNGQQRPCRRGRAGGATRRPPRWWLAPSNPKPWLRSLPPCQQGPGRSRHSQGRAKAHSWRRVPPCG